MKTKVRKEDTKRPHWVRFRTEAFDGERAVRLYGTRAECEAALDQMAEAIAQAKREVDGTWRSDARPLSRAQQVRRLYRDHLAGKLSEAQLQAKVVSVGANTWLARSIAAGDFEYARVQWDYRDQYQRDPL